MAPTFYGVLGVGPDADAEAIERGYRERVTEVHPDVNDDPDADAQFKRLTTARDTLLDADERSRYDRLGHASYVRHHVSCSAWQSTVSGRETPSAGDATQSSGNDRDPSPNGDRSPSESSSDRRRRRKTRPGGTGRSGTRDWNTGQRRRDGDSTTATSRTGSSQRRDSRSGSTGVGATGEHGSSSGDSQTAETGRAGPTATDRGDGHDESRRAGWSARTDRIDSHRSRTTASGDASGRGESTYASSSFWESQRVGQRVGQRNRTGDPLTVRVFRAVQALGVWALIHVAFLAAAVGTSWYVYAVVLDASTASLPLLVVLVGEVLLATVLSSIHILTRIYR